MKPLKYKSDHELKLLQDTVISKIKLDHLTCSVSYISTMALRCIGLKETILNKSKINQILKDKFKSVSVSVGNKTMAVVKRRD